MIIPIKCFTCGKVLADKYLYFLKRVRNIKEKEVYVPYRTKIFDKTSEEIGF